MPLYLASLAKAHAELDQMDDAVRCIGEAMTAFETTGETLWEAEVNRIAGEIALLVPSPDAAKAKDYFERALTFARHQQAKSLELRAATPRAFADTRKRAPFRPNTGHPFRILAETKRVFHVADLMTLPIYQEGDPQIVEAVELGKMRTCLGVLMLKDENLIGAVLVFRQEVRQFSPNQIALITNFTAQAVIAIENARLLKELRGRTEQVEAQSQELGKLNQQLEQRVADQVGEIERMSRLRRFLPPQVADLIVASGSEKQLESHRREITALFCDLRGFTGFTESADAEDVMALLRDYHATVGEKIIRYSGTLERYAGDGVMVVFNDPVPVENPALQAVLMALEMRDAIGALTEKWRRFGHDIGFGIGIAHGYATLGTIGFEGRFDYAAIGTSRMWPRGYVTRRSRDKSSSVRVCW